MVCVADESANPIGFAAVGYLDGSKIGAVFDSRQRGIGGYGADVIGVLVFVTYVGDCSCRDEVLNGSGID